jgi:glycosyltransferase involved in cell wall biosynthesis
MYKVVDYLVQAQQRIDGAPRFRVVSSRGPHLATAPLVMLSAMAQVLLGAAGGRMALLHVNLAQGLSVLRKFLLVYCASWAGVPTVVHVHASKLPQFYARLPRALRLLLRRAFRRPSCVIVLGESARRFVIGELAVDPARVIKLTNGVPEPTAARVPLEAGQPFRLLFLGSQFERKGLPDLLSALARPEVAGLNWQLTVAGSDEARPFRERARELGIEARVAFTGWVDQQRSSELLARADALLLPSYDEGLPLVILEALAHGVPVVCTPVGEIPQFLKDRETALFVQPGRCDELARAIAELMGDSDLRTGLAAAGRSHYRAHFSLEAFTRSLTEIYRRYCGLTTADSDDSEARA